MTLKEIAKEAGVSISTASRIINSKDSTAASPDVQERILSIAEYYNYVPKNTNRKNRVRTADKRQAMRSIACLHARSPKALSDPFFSRLAHSIEEEARKNNCMVKYTFSAIDFENPSILQTLDDDKVDGIAIIGRCDSDILNRLKESYSDMIYIGLNSYDPQCDCVICDGFQISSSAVEYLINLGHRHIAYVGEVSHERRFTGYSAALAENNIPIEQNYIADVALSSEGGYQGMMALLNKTDKLTAVFCSNDITAIGVMRALKETGHNIPGDISVVGVDDIEAAQFLSPTLTTVRVPIEELGAIGAKILIDRINQGHTIPLSISIPHKIIERESCSAVRD